MECVDELKHRVSLSDYPQRIVSLVPSITETLFALGAGERVVGVTSFCSYPAEEVVRIPKVGGTKNPQLEDIVDLAPDIVILNDEENRHEDYVWLEERGVPVYITAPRTVTQGIAMIEGLGELVGCQQAGRSLATRLRHQAATLAHRNQHNQPLRVFCPIWRKPWMSFNADTYCDDMLRCCGAENIFRTHPDRYCTVSLKEAAAADPQLVLLPSEPYPFTEKHFVHLRALAETQAGKAGHFYCVDGMALCWYGPRIADGFEQLSRLLNYVREALDLD